MEDDGPQSGPQGGDIRNSETDTARSAAEESPSAGAGDSSEEQDAVGERASHGKPAQTRVSEQPRAARDNHEPSGGRGPDGRENSDGGGGNWALYLYDLLSSVGIVVLIGALLFTASGIWPPMVAVESGSMQPVMERGDLVFVMESDRFPGPGAHESGVVTARVGENTGYETFDGSGDVIVYEPKGSGDETPIIHRAMFWVEEGENWIEKANPEYLPESAVCEEDGAGANGTDVDNCPAPYSGFITKGDANAQYDQVNSIAPGPIKPAWVVGTAEYAVPYLGNIRLNAQAGGAGNQTDVASSAGS